MIFHRYVENVVYPMGLQHAITVPSMLQNAIEVAGVSSESGVEAGVGARLLSLLSYRSAAQYLRQLDRGIQPLNRKSGRFEGGDETCPS
jgi:hypothetical protein